MMMIPIGIVLVYAYGKHFPGIHQLGNTRIGIGFTVFEGSAFFEATHFLKKQSLQQSCHKIHPYGIPDRRI